MNARGYQHNKEDMGVHPFRSVHHPSRNLIPIRLFISSTDLNEPPSPLIITAPRTEHLLILDTSPFAASNPLPCTPLLLALVASLSLNNAIHRSRHHLREAVAGMEDSECDGSGKDHAAVERDEVGLVLHEGVAPAAGHFGDTFDRLVVGK
jgi:hypothetical protein